MERGRKKERERERGNEIKIHRERERERQKVRKRVWVGGYDKKGEGLSGCFNALQDLRSGNNHSISPLVSTTINAGLLTENLIEPSVLAAQSSQGDEMNSWPLWMSTSKIEDTLMWVNVSLCVI